jgi:hypothetical protein
VSKPTSKTAVIGDPDDEGRNDDELELELDDDDLEPVEEDKPNWVKFIGPMSVDLEVTSYSSDGGRDIDQRPCPEVEGLLLRRAGDLNPGELARITAGQVKLARLLKKTDPKIGQRLVIKYLGLVKVSGGTMKDFEVLRGKVTPSTTRPVSSDSPPF